MADSKLDEILPEPSEASKILDCLFSLAGYVPKYGTGIKAYWEAHLKDIADIRNHNLKIFLTELEKRVSQCEQKIASSPQDEKIQIGKVINKVANNIDDEEFKVLLKYAEKLLNKEIEDTEKYWILDILLKTSPISYKILKNIFETVGTEAISARKFFLHQEDNDQAGQIGIDYGDIDPGVHQALLEMIRNGLLIENHAVFYDEMTCGFIHKIRISSFGIKIIDYLNGR